MGKSQLTQKEIMALTGISRTTLFRLVQEGMPHSEAPNGKKYFDEDVVRTFMKDRRAKIPQEIEVGTNYLNEEIVKIFNVIPSGPVRKSHTRNALVLFVDEGSDGLTNDYWRNDILYFSNHCKRRGSNFICEDKIIAESNTNGITMYLFERVQRRGFQYRGIVKLVDEPFQSKEYCLDGHVMNVWRFPLKLINEKDYLDISQIDEQKDIYESNIRTYLKDKRFTENAEKIELPSNERTVKTKVVQINALIAEYVRMRANGNCELCKQKAPFEYEGKPFLLLEHIMPLEQGGKDLAKNIAAVCPNCSARLGKLRDQSDIKMLEENIDWNEYQLQKKLKGDEQ